METIKNFSKSAGSGISYQQGFNSPVERCDNRAKYAEICNAPEVIQATEQVRKLKAEAAERTANPEECKSLLEKADRLKRSLPIFMYMANYRGEKRCNKDAVLNGLVFIDYDHLDDPQAVLQQVFDEWGGKEECCNLFGILLIKYSVSGHGFHVVAKAQPDEGGIAANQQWFSDNVFHQQHDSQCKDLARGTFATPMADHVWLSDELFTYSNPAFGEQAAASKPAASGSAALVAAQPSVPSGFAAGLPAASAAQPSVPSGSAAGLPAASVALPSVPSGSAAALPAASVALPSVPSGSAAGLPAASAALPSVPSGFAAGLPAASAALPSVPSGSAAGLPSAAPSSLSPASLFHGHSYAEIQQHLWQKLGGEPAEGERHSKLLKMVCELRYICDNSPEFLLKVLVPLSNPLPAAEVEQIIKNACGYKMYNMQAPKLLAAVLAELGITFQQQGSELLTPFEANRQLHEEFYPRFQQLALPPFYRAIISGVEEKQQIGMILGSLPMTATMLTGVEFKHFDNKPSRLSTLFLAVGEAGSGKGNFETLDTILMHTLREQDKQYRAAEKEWTQLSQAEKEKRPKPKGMARVVPVTISNAQLRRRLDEAAPKHLYTFETETATLLSSNSGGSWIAKNDIYCKAFHDEACGADFANGESINGELPVHYNFCITGTPVALDRFINERNVLSGLPDRLLLYPLPDTHFQMLTRVAERTPEQIALMQLTAQKLCSVPDHTTVDAQPITDVFFNWCKEKTDQAREEDDCELDKFRKRAALIGERAAVQYAIIENIDEFIATGYHLHVTQAAIDFGIFVADFALASQYMHFAAMVRKVTEQQAQRRRDLGVRTITNWDNILTTLPNTFTPAEVQKMYPLLSLTSVQKKLQRLAKKGILSTIDYGRYKKTGS